MISSKRLRPAAVQRIYQVWLAWDRLPRSRNQPRLRRLSLARPWKYDLQLSHLEDFGTVIQNVTGQLASLCTASIRQTLHQPRSQALSSRAWERGWRFTALLWEHDKDQHKYKNKMNFTRKNNIDYGSTIRIHNNSLFYWRTLGIIAAVGLHVREDIINKSRGRNVATPYRGLRCRKATLIWFIETDVRRCPGFPRSTQSSIIK